MTRLDEKLDILEGLEILLGGLKQSTGGISRSVDREVRAAFFSAARRFRQLEAQDHPERRDALRAELRELRAELRRARP